MASINEFDFEIKNIKGKENKVVDTLSRSVQTIHLAATSVRVSNIQHRIETLLREDDFFNQVKERMQQESKERKYEGYQIRIDGLFIYHNRMFVPNSLLIKVHGYG